MRKLLVACALTFSLATTSGCAQLIVGGLNILQGILPVSKDQEIAMGAAAAEQILSSPQVRLYDNPQVLAYVQRVGMKMVQQSGRTDLPQKGEPPAWLVPLETHPTIAERIRNLDALITSQHLQGRDLGMDSFRSAMAPLMGGGAGQSRPD